MIVPGSANPLLMAQGGDPLDELGKIERSVRFRDSASASLSRVWAATGNRTKWTTRALIKRSKLTAFQVLFGVDQGGGNYDRWSYRADDSMEYSNGATGTQAAITSAKFRDPAAWCDAVISYDSANATQADRVILTIDGVRQPMSSNSFALDQQSSINVSGTNHFIGGLAAFGGYLAHFCFIDNAVVPASFFGQFHPRTGQWRPKTKAAIRASVATLGGGRNGWGTTGFFLPFDDVTSLATLGYDRSQSDTDTTGNNWTATNISLTTGATYDSMLDTPTDNFATLNRLLPINILVGSYYPILPADGNLKVTGSGAPAANYQNGTQQIKAKASYEMLVGSVGAGTFVIGIQNPVTGATYAYQQDGSKNLNGAVTAYGAAYTTADRVRVAVDPIARTMEFFKQTGGTGAFVSQGVIASAFPDGNYVPFFYASNGTVLTVNFGQQGFESPIADFPSLSTKNLPVNYPVMKGESAFVARTDSGANITATLAAAAPWADWIRIYKRRDAAEGWRWQFSDDSASYLDSSGTAAKAAFPALGGTSYVGYALKVAAANGIATGRLTHVNGVADVVVDGLANSQKVVMLRDEAGGNWFFYHPDLTAGKLLYMNSTAGETTDASISNVTTSGFTVASGLASGTYRWIALAEVDGFAKLSKHVGNAVSDGPFVNSGLSLGLALSKAYSTSGADWILLDAARNAYNVMNTTFRPNTTAGDESSNPRIDATSNGLKVRGPSSAIEPNQSGVSYIDLSFAAFPFRYANAR